MRTFFTTLLGVALLMGFLAATAVAQKPPTTAQPAQPPPAPLTRADKAHKMYSDAESLSQTRRTAEAAAMFEALVRQYPSSDLVPKAMAGAIGSYLAAGQKDKADALAAVMKKNYPTSQCMEGVAWAYVARAIDYTHPAPPEEQRVVLEDYLDKYWDQAHTNFEYAVQSLGLALIALKRNPDADALWCQALSETDDRNLGGLIDVLQRGAGSRKDYAGEAKVWATTAKNVPATVPAWPCLKMLELRYLTLAEAYDEARTKAEAMIKDRPKSEYAAYCALDVCPDLLARQNKFTEAADALHRAMETFAIFVLPRHTQTLADYESQAGNFKAAQERVDVLLSQPNLPTATRALLEQKRNLCLKSSNVDGANAANEALATAFPESPVALAAALDSVANLLTANRLDEAQAASLKITQTYKNHAGVAEAILPLAERFEKANRPEAVKGVREAVIAAYPASLEADAARKALGQPTNDSPTAKAKAVFDEYVSYAKESNVEAARRRIDKLFAEFPSSPHGAAAVLELAEALKKAGKVDLAAELYVLLADKAPYHSAAETSLTTAGAAYAGVSRTADAFAAYDKLVRRFRFSPSWRDYVFGAANALAVQNKLDETRTFLVAAAKSVGDGVPGADLRAFMSRRFAAQEKWQEAADEMLTILGDKAADPLYRSLTGEVFCWITVAEQQKKEPKPDAEVKLLENLAARYNGWDEADRIRISVAGIWARYKNQDLALQKFDEIAKRHPKYEIGTTGTIFVSRWSRSLFLGTVGYAPVDRVAAEMSGGWSNILYAHHIDDMISSTLLLNSPQVFIDRVKASIAKAVQAGGVKTSSTLKYGLPYKSKNLPTPTVQPTPEQRRLYLMVNDLDSGYGGLGQRVDNAMWFEVYPLWPNHYQNDERLTNAAVALCARDQVAFQRAVGLLKANYNELLWMPNVLLADGNHNRDTGGKNEAAKLFLTIVQRFPDHEVAPTAAQAYKDLTGRAPGR